VAVDPRQSQEAKPSAKYRLLSRVEDVLFGLVVIIAVVDVLLLRFTFIAIGPWSRWAAYMGISNGWILFTVWLLNRYRKRHRVR